MAHGRTNFTRKIMFVSRTPETLTINHTVYDRIRRDHPEPMRTVPFLRMSGIWMEQYGFMPGDKVAVSVEQGVMTLRVMEREKPKGRKRKK